MIIFRFFLIILTITISSCSFQAPESQWKVRSKNAFSSYTNNFLSGNTILAKNDLKRAIRHINVSADLNKLARLYLSVCALNKAVGLNDKCNKYLEIHDLSQNPELSSYYDLLQGQISKHSIQNLPLSYQAFAKFYEKRQYRKAIKSLELIEKPSSRFIAASIIKEKLTAINRNRIIEEASYFGYKSIVTFWLKEQLQKTLDSNEKQILLKKINILQQSL